MAEVNNNTPPTDGGTPPTDPIKDNGIDDKTNNTNTDDKNTDPETLKINEIIQKQIGTFQDSFIKKFNEEYQDKLSKLKSDQNELSEKKQQLAVIDELKTAKMDSSLIDFVYDKDIEVSKIKIKQLSDLITVEVQRGIEDRLRKNAYTPPKGTDNTNFSSNFKKPKYVV